MLCACIGQCERIWRISRKYTRIISRADVNSGCAIGGVILTCEILIGYISNLYWPLDLCGVIGFSYSFEVVTTITKTEGSWLCWCVVKPIILRDVVDCVYFHTLNCGIGWIVVQRLLHCVSGAICDVATHEF